MPPAAATAAGRAPKTRSTAVDDEIKITRRTLTPAERVKSYGGGALATEYAPPSEPAVPEPRQTRRPASQPPRQSTRETSQPSRVKERRPVSNRTAATAAAHAPRRVSTAIPSSNPRRREAAEASPPKSPRGAPRKRTLKPSLTLSLAKPHLNVRTLRLDRIVRGRAWIPVLGVMLFAIVGMRVEVLKMGTHVGASVQEAAQLQGENQVLQAKVATLAEPDRIERLARGMHMYMPGPMGVTIVSLKSGRRVAKAISAIHAPDSATFESDLRARQLANTQSEDAIAAGSTDTTDTVSSVDESAQTELSTAG